jgi:HEAT repeats
MLIRTTAILTLVVLLGACQTTVTKGGVQLTEEEIEQLEAVEDSEPMDFVSEKVKAVVENLDLRHGSGLLRDIQYLVSLKELAVDPVTEALPNVSARSRANLVYVLGFTKSPEAREAIVSALGDDDEIVRFEASAALMQQGDLSGIPRMIEYLDDKNPQYRYKAIQALRLATSRDFDYHFSASPEERAIALNRWQKWWQVEKNRLMTRGPVSAGE